MLTLRLSAVPPTWLSPYGPKGALVPLPKRMALLHPDALASLAPLIPALVLTDVFRSPAASLAARAAKKGVAAPGFSAHNFGAAVDADVKKSVKRLGVASKAGLDAAMAQCGWRCFRADHEPAEAEAWHFSWGADGPGSLAVERAIQRVYPASAFALSLTEAQEALASLRLYAGIIDGDFGRQSKAALAVFQRGWNLPDTGKLDARTQRVLAVVTARKIVDGEAVA